MSKISITSITRPIRNYYHLAQAVAASVYYGFPAKRLKIVGVTGTDGKTTTVTLVYEILKAWGKPVGMISTVEALIGGQSYETGFHVTSPDPWALQRFLKQMVKAGSEYVVLEVTSHALDQYRVWGIPFEVGVFTNITRDHFDYHQDYAGYLGAKAKLLPLAKKVVLNRDDQSFGELEGGALALGKHKSQELVSYGFSPQAEIRIQAISSGVASVPKSLSPPPFSCQCIDTVVEANTILTGRYNQSNLAAAVSATYLLGVPLSAIQAGISNFRGVTGRWQKIDGGQNFTALLDFAHTPNASEVMLQNCRQQMVEGSKLTVVFGCAGLRDKGKRPQMGEIAGRLANYTVLTAEDPRTESIDAIMEQIAVGCRAAGAKEAFPAEIPEGGGHYFVKVPDRERAIEWAITQLARPGDWVVVTGKGHEQSMCYGTTERPWSDREVMEKALREIVNR